MTNLTFKCYRCHRSSPFKITSDNRSKVQRLRGSGEKLGKVHFICVHCGYSNEIEVTLSQAIRLIQEVDSDNPEILGAINKARSGDFLSAAAIAKRKLGL